MELADRIEQLRAQIPKAKGLKTEEATKNALIMPFINMLGYNVFDPTEVEPEYIADVPGKKGEKVDYAIKKDGKFIILIECKISANDLNDVHASQLYRYFTVTDVRIGILTNGVVYHFFTDLEAPNRMDTKPFLVVDLRSFDPGMSDELKRFTKAEFDLEKIRSAATGLKYRHAIQQHIAAEFQSPSEPFVRHLASKIHSGRMTQSVLDEFTSITKLALQQFIDDQLRNRLQPVLNASASDTTKATSDTKIPATESKPQSAFTDEEREGFFVVKAILREIVDHKKITARDQESYCGILFEDNNRKPICRLHFNRKQKYLGLFDANKNEERVPINDLDEIYKYADRLKATVTGYIGAGASS